MKLKIATAALALLTGTCLVAETETNSKVVDIFVGFDQSAKQYLAGIGQTMEGLAQTQVDRLNACVANSGLDGDFTFRLVGTADFDVDTSAFLLVDILGNLKNAQDASGVWKKVWAKRDELGADLFSFVTGGDIKGAQRGFGWTLGCSTGVFGVSESQGLASMPSDWITQCSNYYCFNVLSVLALAEPDDYTLAHEIGHNMGCGHSDSFASDGQKFYNFSAGYEVGGYVTVMGYPTLGVIQIAPVFSSPAVQYVGLAMGDATHDNVRTLRNNYAFVAQYRASKDASGGGSSAGGGSSSGGDATAEEVLGFTPAGAFNPEKAVAINAESPYVGAFYDEKDVLAGVVLLKVGKANAKKGTCKVSGTLVLPTGKKFAVKAGEVTVGSGPQTAKGLVVNKLGTLDLVLAKNGFTGVFTGTASPCLGASWKGRTADVMGGLSLSPATFWMDPVEKLNDLPVIADCLPGGTPVRTVGAKWQLDKAAKVKYAKMEDGTLKLVIDTAGGKENVSGLKLTYAPKTGSFKGSFTFYADAGTADKPKLKKFKAAVTGVVADGVGSGLAEVKKIDSWPVTIK